MYGRCVYEDFIGEGTTRYYGVDEVLEDFVIADLVKC